MGKGKGARLQGDLKSDGNRYGQYASGRGGKGAGDAFLEF